MVNSDSLVSWLLVGAASTRTVVTSLG